MTRGGKIHPLRGVRLKVLSNIIGNYASRHRFGMPVVVHSIVHRTIKHVPDDKASFVLRSKFPKQENVILGKPMGCNQ